MAAPASDDRLTAALACRARGWSVIPVAPHGKRPLLPWRSFQARLASVAEVRRWFERWPDANFAIVTGRLSGLVVLDIDPRHGGADSVAAFEAERGPLPATIEVLTGGGGRHLYFRHPGARVGNRVGLRPGIDLRADGGCVVAPPSVHPSGRRYAWRPGCAPDDLPPAPLPRGWLQAR
jgi:hypothetical protein